MFHKLIVGIMFFALSFAMPATADEKQSAKDEKKPAAEEKKYPPYPDVWDWHEPSTSGHPFSMFRLPDGDVLIEFIKKSAKTKKIEVYAVTFFERKVFTSDDARQIIKNAEEYMHKRGGRDLEARLNYMKYKAISPDGTWIIKSEYAYDLHCYLGANRYPYKLKNTKTGQERIFTIFQLLDKPEKFFVNGRYERVGKDVYKEHSNATCDSEMRRTVKYKVKSVSGGFFFLDDNSFLFHVEDTGEVIRFNIDLKSKSNFVGNRVFLIENNGEPSVTHLLTGKDYEDDVDPIVETEDLYNYLITIKKKGRK